MYGLTILLRLSRFSHSSVLTVVDIVNFEAVILSRPKCVEQVEENKEQEEEDAE